MVGRRLINPRNPKHTRATNRAADAARLDRAEAPQREIERANKMTEDNRAAGEKARVINKPLFKP